MSLLDSSGIGGHPVNRVATAAKKLNSQNKKAKKDVLKGSVTDNAFADITQQGNLGPAVPAPAQGQQAVANRINLVSGYKDDIPFEESVAREARRLLVTAGEPFGQVNDIPEDTAKFLLERVVNKKMIEQDLLLVDSIDWNSPAELAHCYKMIPDVKGLIDRQIAFAKCIAQVQLAMAEVALKGAFFDNNTWEFYKSMKLTNWNGNTVIGQNGLGATNNKLPNILSRPVHELQAADLLDLRQHTAQMVAMTPGMSVFDSLFTTYAGETMVKSKERFRAGVTEYLSPALKYDAPATGSKLFNMGGPTNSRLRARNTQDGALINHNTNTLIIGSNALGAGNGRSIFNRQ
jgi:hypothetical protein